MNNGRESYLKKRDELTSQLYPTIGKAVIAFETLCHELRNGVGIILEDSGLRDGSNYADILVGDLTMFPLLNIYRGLIFENQKPNAIETKILDAISKAIIDIAEERNEIVHSAWYIDYKSVEDIEKNMLVQYRPGASKRGAKESPNRIPLTKIQELIATTYKYNELVEELNMCIYQGTKIENRFVIDENGDIMCKGSFMDSVKKSNEVPNPITGCPNCVPIPGKSKK